MKSIRCQVYLITALLLFTITAPISNAAQEAQEITTRISSWLVLGPHPVPLPAFHEEKRRSFTLEDLLKFNDVNISQLKPIADSYTVFVHLLDGSPEGAEAPLKTQHDGIPCDATEPTWRWQLGEYILDEHTLAVPPKLPAGEYLLGVGLYDSNTLERLAPTGKDLQIRWNEAIVRTVTVTNGPNGQ